MEIRGASAGPTAGIRWGEEVRTFAATPSSPLKVRCHGQASPASEGRPSFAYFSCSETSRPPEARGSGVGRTA